MDSNIKEIKKKKGKGIRNLIIGTAVAATLYFGNAFGVKTGINDVCYQAKESIEYTFRNDIGKKAINFSESIENASVEDIEKYESDIQNSLYNIYNALDEEARVESLCYIIDNDSSEVKGEFITRTYDSLSDEQKFDLVYDGISTKLSESTKGLRENLDSILGTLTNLYDDVFGE